MPPSPPPLFVSAVSSEHKHSIFPQIHALALFISIRKTIAVVVDQNRFSYDCKAEISYLAFLLQTASIYHQMSVQI